MRAKQMDDAMSLDSELRAVLKRMKCKRSINTSRDASSSNGA